MSQKLQELKYESYDECSRLYAVPNLKKQKITTLCKSAIKLYDEAEKQYEMRDEEQSFILYMKYFNVVNVIRENPEFSGHKNYVMALLGSHNKQNKAMERTEELSKSLRKRYELLRRSKESEMEEHVPDDEMPEVPEKVTSLTSYELFEMIKAGGKGLLVLDCRPKRDFIASKLLFEQCLNIPEDAILPGMTAGKMYHALSPAERILWDSRGEMECIVLIDWSTRGKNPIRNTPLWYLKDILENWDPDVNYKVLVILDGGYEDYLLRYPMQTTNPRAQPPVTIKEDEGLLEEIEYPTIGDIVMKKDTFGGEGRPNVDRGSKAAAVVTYEQKEKMMQDILQQQEKIAEKVLTVEKERLNAEKVWDELNEIKKQKVVADEENIAQQTREQELIYSIMQFENQQRDYMAENERLKRQLGEMEAALEEATVARIQNKDRERKRLQEEREQMEAEREKKLKVAREQKKLLREDKENHQHVVVPPINRSAKPQSIIFPQRGMYDLAAVPGSVDPGLTGLKNLGNSCYMNSIVQCLSNSPSLTEYIIQGGYKKHINSTGKTQGRIIEELAIVVDALWARRYRYISPLSLKFTIGAIHGVFREFEQQDAHEFLTIFIDMLHVDLQTIDTRAHIRENLSMSEKAWSDFTQSRESAILRLFYGQIKSTVKCKVCGAESATYESSSNLSLELPATNTRCSIEDCFDTYFNGENISGWNCPGCRQSRNAVKKLDISKLPPILVIHLKRFYADDSMSTSQYRKKQNYVRFPLKDLDLSPYIARSGKNSPQNISPVCRIKSLRHNG
uniref:ubiquitinyl hydrolase 1 n=1 Tax=Lutzomyia longipalpis TaxID=7200 RepID=A0A1B0CIJ8_LUTLO